MNEKNSEKRYIKLHFTKRIEENLQNESNETLEFETKRDRENIEKFNSTSKSYVNEFSFQREVFLKEFENYAFRNLKSKKNETNELKRN